MEVIKDLISLWNSPIWVAPKKKDALGKIKWCLVVDYRKLNKRTITDNFLVSNIDEIIDHLGNSKYFSAFDVARGFHKFGMHLKDTVKTAFSTSDVHCEYNRMSFELKNAPPTFQRMINNGLKTLIVNGCFINTDDIVVYENTIKEHNDNLKKLFQRSRHVNLKSQPSKCEYLSPELEYLGYLITADKTKLNPVRIIKVKNYPDPKNAKEVNDS